MAKGAKPTKASKRSLLKDKKDEVAVPKKVAKKTRHIDKKKTSKKSLASKIKGTSKAVISLKVSQSNNTTTEIETEDNYSGLTDEEGTNVLMDIPILDEKSTTITTLDTEVNDSNDGNDIPSSSSIKRNVPSRATSFDMNEKSELVCTLCLQNLNTIKFYNNEPLDGKATETNCILDNRLALFDDEEKNNHAQEDIRAFNKITCYSVYCKNGHYCRFDSGLIEKGRNIYFSGYVKPIYSDDTSITKGINIPVKSFGPIVAWWITGYGVGESPTVSISTELGDYLLMEPSPEYAPYMKFTILKIFMSKEVIEFVINEPNASYEDLLYKIQTMQIPDDLTEMFTEDDLMHLAPFICNQMISFDEFSNPEEQLLLVTPCIRRLIDLAGIDFRFKYPGKPQLMRMRGGASNNRRKKLFESDETNIKLHLSCKESLIDLIFHYNQIISLPSNYTKSSRKCENCDNCLRPTCGECDGCLQKKNCWKKRCFWLEVQNANKQDEENNTVVPSKHIKYCNQAYLDLIGTFKEFNKDITLLGPSIAFDNGNTYYKLAKVAGLQIAPGDFVLLRSDKSSVSSQVLKIVYIWEDDTGEPKFHGNFYWWGKDTVLGEFANPKEIFYVGLCIDVTLLSIQRKVRVVERQKPIYWDEMKFAQECDEDTMFCEKAFDILTGRFYEIPKEDKAARENSPVPHRFCQIQENIDFLDAKKVPCVFNKLGEEDCKIIYENILFQDEKYFVESTVYIKPKKLYYRYPMSYNNRKLTPIKNELIDSSKYTEAYRKKEEKCAMSSQSETYSPLDIGFITQIYTIEGKIFVKVKKFYRPENTHDGKTLSQKSNINLLFWSEEESVIEFVHVVGKCYVAHEKLLKTSVDIWAAGGPNRFYFSKEYKSDEKKFIDVDPQLFKRSLIIRDIPKDYPTIRKLKTLSIFSGCGGLALGLQRSGLSKICWAIESDEVAASVFRLNFTKTTVLNANVKSVLIAMRNGENELNGQKLPTEEEVELLCASIPGKSYNSLENFKNSHVATFIEYCEYYRPALFVIDADESLVKQNSFLKLTLSCLVAIGYQVSFNLMQSGNYGVPQDHKRSVLLGAAPGHKLPYFPKHLHVFPRSLSQYFVIVDNKKYSPVIGWNNSAPFRAITVNDAISDLPIIAFGQYKNNLDYYSKLSTHYQKLMRFDIPERDLFDHECKKLGVLPETRILLMSQAQGTDWRNLPNISLKLSDGSYAHKLLYTHDDIVAGRSKNGELQGVCSCANGGVCDMNYRQEKTIIPWHLVHTAKKHNQWAGLYGRLEWNGFFKNITNPEPLGTEGPVIHPHQPRIVSVRECARAHGYPDDFKLGDKISIADKYRVIGQSPSPFLYICVGSEIVKSLL